MKRIAVLFFTATLALIACNEKPATIPGGFDSTGYETAKVDGTETFHAVKYDPAGNILEEGMLTAGLQEGTWVTYWSEEEHVNKIKTVASYVRGVINGPYMEFNNRGQIEKRATYLNNQIHGLYSEYKFGRPLKEYMYDNGVLDGVSKEYSDRGKLAKETAYTKGKLDGSYKQYDEEGNVVLEYEYKNGEKVSGGIVEKE